MPLAAPSVFAYTQPADMRKSLPGLVRHRRAGAEANGGVGPSVSIFQSPPQCVKVLYFVGDGLVIFYKRLETRDL